MALDPLVALRLRARLRHGKPIRYSRPKKWLHPTSAERAYEARVVGVVDVVHNVAKALIMPELPRLTKEASRLRGDTWADDLDRLTRDLKLRVDQEVQFEDRMALTAAIQVSDWNQKQWRDIVRGSLGVDLFTSEPWLQDDLRSWASQNANLITTLEDDAIRQIGIWTQKGVREGWRPEDIAKNIEDRFDVSRNKARFLARDQTGKLNGDLTQKRQTTSGVIAYFWRDSRDERVRGNPGGIYPRAVPSHWDRNGERFLWAKPPAGGHPGSDYGCRCTAEPDLQGLLDTFS